MSGPAALQDPRAGDCAAGRLLSHQAYPVHPWRNGRGLLRHIAAGDGWQLRLADIAESGPFSDYTGHWRHFAIVEGSVVLQMPEGARIDCDPESAVAVFDGGAAPHCRLVGGPARALNLIVETGKVVASLARRAIGGADGEEASGERGALLLIHVQSGQLACRWRRPGRSVGTARAFEVAGGSALARTKDTLMLPAEARVLLRATPGPAGDATAVVLIARIGPTTA